VDRPEGGTQRGASFGRPGRRLAVILGSARPGEASRLEVADRVREGRRVPGSLSTATLMAGPAFAVGAAFGATGPVFVVSGTCASGTLAVITAMNLLRTGQADVVISGGTEACLTTPYLAQTAALRILSAGVCRPFDERRDGTLLGEGAGLLVLERAGEAGGRALAILRGSGVAYDGAVLADQEGGEALEQAILEALREAGASASEIGAVCAHAAGTRKGDAIEAGVLARVLGGRPVPVSSYKSCVGHTLGAAGGIELALAVRSLVEGLVPPTANLERPDPALPLDFPREAREGRIGLLLKTASAMGGLHAALLLSR
jgi:3-oxoacyl-[acyl-carrier-protein] synthase II